MAGPNFMRSPIFGTPQVQPGILNLGPKPAPSDMRRKQQFQAIGDTLSQLGIGLMSQPTSTTPQSPLMGLAQGLQGANQMMGQRAQEAQDQRRMDMADAQFGMQQEEFGQKQQDRAYEEAQRQKMEELISTLPADQQTAARAHPEAFWSAYAQSKFPKEGSQPNSVQEYEYAKSQGYQGSLLDFEKEKAAAGRAPTQPDKPTADIQEYQFAVSQGFKGSYMDYLASKKGQGFSMQLPDGTTVQMGGAVKPPNEAQMNAASRAQLIQEGLNGLEQLYDDPNINPYRMAGADTLAGAGPMGNAVANKLKTDQEQQWAAYKASALEGLAASVTGAGVSQDQFTRYTNMLPDPNDKPETRKVKLRAANNYLRVLLRNAGAAGQAVLDNLPKPEDAAAPKEKPKAESAGPKVAPTEDLKQEDGWQ